MLSAQSKSARGISYNFNVDAEAFRFILFKMFRCFKLALKAINIIYFSAAAAAACMQQQQKSKK